MITLQNTNKLTEIRVIHINMGVQKTDLSAKTD